MKRRDQKKTLLNGATRESTIVAGELLRATGWGTGRRAPRRGRRGARRGRTRRPGDRTHTCARPFFVNPRALSLSLLFRNDFRSPHLVLYRFTSCADTPRYSAHDDETRGYRTRRMAYRQYTLALQRSPLPMTPFTYGRPTHLASTALPLARRSFSCRSSADSRCNRGSIASASCTAP